MAGISFKIPFSGLLQVLRVFPAETWLTVYRRRLVMDTAAKKFIRVAPGMPREGTGAVAVPSGALWRAGVNAGNAREIGKLSQNPNSESHAWLRNCRGPNQHAAAPAFLLKLIPGQLGLPLSFFAN